MGNKKNKTKNNKKSLNKKPSSIKTLSGLSGSSLTANLVSAAFGIMIFVIGPYAINKYGNTYAAAMLNIPPTGIIMTLFISEEEFGPFLKKLVWTPFFFVILNAIIYYLYFYQSWTPLSIIYLCSGVWLLAFIIACFL
jgi:hypothetical protein